MALSPAAAPAAGNSFDPQTGLPVAIAPGIVRVTAPNASAYTFTGTNSFILGDAGEVAVIDPGPDSESHLEALLDAVAGRPVRAILLTHTHRDHSALAPRLAERAGSPLWFGGPHRLSRPKKLFEVNPHARAADWDLAPVRQLVDGEAFNIGEMKLTVHATPGHCANHLAFGIAGTPYLICGDHVMGWSSTLVASPDGAMDDYLASLDKLLELPYEAYLPAHGGPIGNGKARTKELKAHRLHRDAQILSFLEGGAKSLLELREHIYPDIPAANRGAAEQTLKAHLEYLDDRGLVTSSFQPFQKRYRRA